MTGTQNFYRFGAAMEKYRENINEAKKPDIYNSEITDIHLFRDNAMSIGFNNTYIKILLVLIYVIY